MFVDFFWWIDQYLESSAQDQSDGKELNADSIEAEAVNAGEAQVEEVPGQATEDQQ